MNWRQGWAVVVKTRRKGTPIYFARYFRTRLSFLKWSIPHNEIIREINFGG